MSNTGVPVGQLAYQASAIKGYAASIKCFAQTSNRFSSGATAYNSVGDNLGPMGCLPVRKGRRGWGFLPLLGNVSTSNTGAGSGGSGYVVNDTVTFTAVNGGRPVVVKVTAVSSGAVTAVSVLDPGSGIAVLPVGQNVLSPTSVTLTQASTSGVGTGAAWSFVPAWGWTTPQPNPAA
jgi:hypothetical protein